MISKPPSLLPPQTTPSPPATLKPFNLLFQDCPVYTNDSEALIDSYKFWIEGVTQTSIAIPGFIGKFVVEKSRWLYAHLTTYSPSIVWSSLLYWYLV